jgi:hypothetical protein
MLQLNVILTKEGSINDINLPADRCFLRQHDKVPGITVMLKLKAILNLIIAILHFAFYPATLQTPCSSRIVPPNDTCNQLKAGLYIK